MHIIDDLLNIVISYVQYPTDILSISLVNRYYHYVVRNAELNAFDGTLEFDGITKTEIQELYPNAKKITLVMLVK